MLVVFSDLDGTLLDHDTYDYTPALEAVAFLKQHAMPLILVSSKTLPEMKGIHSGMGLSSPYIFENGGGIVWPGTPDRVEYLGLDVSALKAERKLIDAEIGEPVQFITDMKPEEIAARTGLSLEKALLAQQRLTSLPFVLGSGRNIGLEELERINDSLRKNGFSMTRGGRFYHFLSSRSDKGQAINRVIDYYRKKGGGPVTTMGIGDSENDISMFKTVDIPVVVRKKDGACIETGINTIRKTRGIGPEGFSEAIFSFAADPAD